MENADTIKMCEQCGAPLPAEAPQGLCPKCLLQVGLGSGFQPLPSTNPPGRADGPSPEELGKWFPHLEIVEVLGQGGMGVVYKARQTKLDRWVALKILPREAAREAHFAERFTREAQALARLTHPNIVAVHDSGQAGEYFYFIMEFVDGANLRQVTRLGGANFAPSWHPDGKRLIFASNVHDPKGRDFDLYLINVDGSGLERVTFNDTFDGFPMFSPDGTKLVFASNRNAAKPGDTNIFIAEWVD